MAQNMAVVGKKTIPFCFNLPRLFSAFALFFLVAAGTAQADSLQKGMELYEKGQYAESFALIKKSAEAKQPEGQAMLAYCYANGIGTKTNEKQAVAWYKKAAEQGLSEAQYQLGKRYEEGIGISQNYQEAMKWYEMASKQKHVSAQMALALMYWDGKGVSRSFSDACRVFGEESIKDRVAQYYIARCLEKGVNVPNINSDNDALKWYLLSAKQAYVPAMVSLGSIYFSGRGAAQDYSEGIKWIKQAAQKGDAKAQAVLGLAYEKGFGVGIDKKEAIKWYTLSADQGNADAIKILDELKKNAGKENHL